MSRGWDSSDDRRTHHPRLLCQRRGLQSQGSIPRSLAEVSDISRPVVTCSSSSIPSIVESYRPFRSKAWALHGKIVGAFWQKVWALSGRRCGRFAGRGECSAASGGTRYVGAGKRRQERRSDMPRNGCGMAGRGGGSLKRELQHCGPVPEFMLQRPGNTPPSGVGPLILLGRHRAVSQELISTPRHPGHDDHLRPVRILLAEAGEDLVGSAVPTLFCQVVQG
jgi:hypothetical protein